MVFNTSTKRAAPPSDSPPAKKQRFKSADTDSDAMSSRSETPGQQDFHGPFITLRVKDTDEHGNLREYDFKVHPLSCLRCLMPVRFPPLCSVTLISRS